MSRKEDTVLNLTEIFEAVSPSIIAFITRLKVTRVGQAPVFPKVFGTGFFLDRDGIAATNRHVIEAFDRIPRHPKTGESSLAAILFLPVKAPGLAGGARVVWHAPLDQTGG